MKPPQNVKFQFENNSNVFSVPSTDSSQSIGSFATPNDTTPLGGNTRTPQFFKDLISPISEKLSKSPGNLFFATPSGKSFLDSTKTLGDTPALFSDDTSELISPQTTTPNVPNTSSRQEREFQHHKASNIMNTMNPLSQDKTQLLQGSGRDFLSVDPKNYTVVSPQNFTVVSNKIALIEGFNTPVVQKVPGGKGNTKDCIPRQVVELKLDQFPNVNPTSLSCTCEVLGFDRKSNSMVALGQVMAKSFIQTTDKRWLAVFDHCVVKYSSHLNGQKLALRFSLVDRKTNSSICFVDSKHFQTITQRGREKQAKRKRRRSPESDELADEEPELKRLKISSEPWTAIEISYLLNGTQKYGEDWESILKNFNFRPSRTASHLSLKYDQLLSP